MQANRKKISQSKLLEAVEIMLFEAIASHSRILENARSQAEAVMEDDSLMDSVIDDLAEVGESIERILSILKDLSNNSDKSNNANIVNVLSNLIYYQFTTSSSFNHPMGVILNGNRERFCMKLMLAKLNNILKKRRLLGLFDSGNCLLTAISSGTTENGDIMYCLYSPIEALNVKRALRYQYITTKCYWKWRSTVRDAMLADGSQDISLKQYFSFYAVDV